ncbi:hypothetical protein B4N89_37215 [Embleya scabrispora]|uniref:DUF4303 domain-containing protein n=1 Tax=Embleya scabrispora TaxID=159449 RepID=A0A1T3NM40_9ACTN|nr:DUF4303 domain-containing protein [Embleya scabrispora]OPC77896.1 hypothetical protein B4N89_37215 [Embleya scabrispora]
MIPTEADLTEAVYRAAGAAVSDLFREFPEHDFYYCALVTPGEAFGPSLSAWSSQALATAAGGSATEADMLRWSYADSPFCTYGERHLAPIRSLFDARPQVFELPDDEAEAEFELRLRAMVAAMARLDAEGLFGHGEQRLSIVAVVEVPGDDAENAARASALNPPTAAATYVAANSPTTPLRNPR